MTQPTGKAAILAALDQRLRAVGEVLLAEPPTPIGLPTRDANDLLVDLVAELQREPDQGRIWLFLSAFTARLPRPDDVRAVRRRLELLAPRDASTWLLSWGARTMTLEDASAQIEVVRDRPVVDVDFTSSNDLATGIQRVVRNLLPRWTASRDLALVRWEDDCALVGLNSRQQRRVLGEQGSAAAATSRRIVPWEVPVLLPEVPFPAHAERLAALAEFSANRVGIVGYDCIPVVSADLVNEAEREKFGEYIEVVKYVDTVAGISRSAAAEFEGFAATLASQGLTGPAVVACGLPTTEVVRPVGEEPARSDLPEVLCVGSLDRRKNQIALVEAAEHLWREGLRFRLRLMGSGGGQPADLRRLINDLRDAGRLIEVAKEVTDAVLDAAYRGARVLVFPTLHEGFGLPVVEALSYGVPVITSDFGSTREIGEGNGAVLIDPHDVGALVDALRDVLSDDELHAGLVAAARSREVRSWDDYANELWQVLVG